MPRVLIVAAENPFPADSGGRLRVGNILGIIARHFQVDLLTYERAGQVAPPANVRITTAARTVTSKRAALRSLFRRRNGSWISHADIDLAAPLSDLLRKHSYAAVLLESSMLGALIEPVRKLQPTARVIVDAHNFETALSRQIIASQATALRQCYFTLNAHFTRNDEARVLKRADVLLVCSDDDARQFRTLSSAPRAQIAVIPNFLNGASYEPQPLRAGERNELLLHGDMQYWPNVNAALYFYREIFPLIRARRPGVRWSIVGRNCHPSITAAVKGDDSVSVVGDVPRMSDYIVAADVVVVPLLEGSGTRFKILEAWALGRPVVSTTIGAEGLGCTSGDAALLADTPSTFADATLRVLEDRELAERLAARGHAAYVSRFHVDAVEQALLRQLSAGSTRA